MGPQKSLGGISIILQHTLRLVQTAKGEVLTALPPAGRRARRSANPFMSSLITPSTCLVRSPELLFSWNSCPLAPTKENYRIF